MLYYIPIDADLTLIDDENLEKILRLAGGQIQWLLSAMKMTSKTSQKRSANFLDLSSIIPNVSSEFLERVVI